ncbi:MAG: 3-deoxy-D-manno-octulosonic acid transferase [Comamonadaceae bacterium CG_4_9_14_3_um_filter_60_33]|nr:MAG: 3-deoxy-D-manno-octulosonic acid transferase [Comamonadaceae bacterium CG_4_10_14_3_um_filter_60_42]PJB46833.1 MAG: 3-deoxy-D-manno-octulosonic acid transferase [Comamonadaceae bacterium CG_4_9_14_3_um_filter_60_33]
MTRWFYSWFMWLAQPLLRRKLARRSVQEPGYGQFVEERFGRYKQLVPVHNGPTLWIHAVSLGETRAAAVLVTALRQQLPKMRLLLTHGTATGRAEGLKLLKDGDLQTWQPWDTPAAVRRFLSHFKPDLGILMETEVWPNLVTDCDYLGVPLMLVNARLSDKSLRKTQRLAWLARPAYAALAAVWAQTPQDAQRLQFLGARVQGVLGNLKFDAAPNADQLSHGRSWRAQLARPVVMFASSREGEELALLELLSRRCERAESGPVQHADHDHDLVAAREVRQSMHSEVMDCVTSFAMTGVENVQWLIVPRHPQRFDAVAALIESHGFVVQRRSRWGQGGPVAPDTATPTIWLGDSLGEMALYYGLADAALLGGSFEPLGGQNLIEAAACGCPVVMGPHTFNFAAAAEQALAAGAAQRVQDLTQGVVAASGIALNPALHRTMVQASADLFGQNRGAVERTVRAVRQLLDQQDVDGV